MLIRAARGIKRAIWSSAKPIEFEARTATLSEWLTECINEHPKCQNTLSRDAPLAKRILEVLTDSGEPLLRLVSSENVDLHRVPYVVLSHCWGGVDIDSKTTLANVDGYYTSIDISDLPMTFREAIQITRALKLRYLWIDSLCIIQKHAPDWECESSKMASIFRNATITLSASTASNSTQGCGITTILPPSTQFTLPARAAFGQTQAYLSIREITTSDPGEEGRKSLMHSPIHKRAWIFQEKFLSRRILHATHGLFIYQCATHIESEDSLAHDIGRGEYWKKWEVLPSHVPEHVVRVVGHKPGSFRDIRNRWWGWVPDYARRELTNPKDNYAALAGVIALYRDMTRDEPVLGMWRNDLVLHLGWQTSYDGVRFPSDYKPEERRPSWTWMSFPHGTAHPIHVVEFENINRAFTPHELSLTIRYKAKVLDINVKWSGRPLVTSPSHATLRLEGLKHRLPKRDYKAGGEFHLDRGIVDPNDNREYDVFALYANEREGFLKHLLPTLQTTYLVLEAVNREQNVYRRIGCYSTSVRFALGAKADDYFFGTFEEIVLV
jgi:hypothetical protein